MIDPARAVRPPLEPRPHIPVGVLASLHQPGKPQPDHRPLVEAHPGQPRYAAGEEILPAHEPTVEITILVDDFEHEDPVPVVAHQPGGFLLALAQVAAQPPGVVE